MGCDKGSGAATSFRSEQVIATGVPSGARAPSDSTAHVRTNAQRGRKLCEGDGNVKGRALPKTPALHAEATGAPRLDGMLPTERGQWTWVNLWAAWCGPCKEEMPRLLSWRDKLMRAGTPIQLVFVSLDDDERQLRLFLDAQPVDGVQTTLWLPEGSARAGWLKSLRIASAPELPQQALVGASGRLRCFIEGAVEDDDYQEIAALVAR
ncbi:MAG TPA: TlpA disulfide reductase family protein [Polyangiaceae bacterium]|nr:TlpA disulfide reductase family protein [Polyangiaceae bacterium]